MCVWFASLLCIIVPLGVIEELLPFRDVQVLYAYLYQYLFVGIFILILVPFVIRVVFVREVWLLLTRGFFVTCVIAGFILFAYLYA